MDHREFDAITQRLEGRNADRREGMLVERAAAQAIDETELVTSEPVTVSSCEREISDPIEGP